MKPAADSPTANIALSGVQKTALLLIAVGEQTAAGLLQKLGEEAAKSIGSAMAELSVVSSEQTEQVLNEFHQRAATSGYRGGPEVTRKLLTTAFGREFADQRISEVTGSATPDGSSLQRADAQQLARLLREEHPQTIAFILASLRPARAAELLSPLPQALRAEVATRIARLDKVSPAVINRIAAVIGRKLASLGETQRRPSGGPRAVAEIFTRVRPTLADEILDGIAAGEETLAREIRDLMFVFEDLVKVGHKGIKEVLGRVDRKLLMTALKGTSDELKGQFLKCMSQGGAEMFLEDMEALGPIRLKDVEAAQKQVIATARQLDAEGSLSLRGGGADEYVV